VWTIIEWSETEKINQAPGDKTDNTKILKPFYRYVRDKKKHFFYKLFLAMQLNDLNGRPIDRRFIGFYKQNGREIWQSIRRQWIFSIQTLYSLAWSM